jgi:hypothetical protein
MAWRLAERVTQEKLLVGDAVEVAFTLDHNDHPEFGGIELALRDFRVPASRKTDEKGYAASAPPRAQEAARS